jgi:hypothetical protein
MTTKKSDNSNSSSKGQGYSAKGSQDDVQPHGRGRVKDPAHDDRLKNNDK